MTTGIERIVDKSRKDPKLCFTSLAHHLRPDLLWRCLCSIDVKTSPGIDGQSVEEAKATFAEWSKEMLASVHKRGYKPPPARRVYIPKPGRPEARRPLAVPAVADRSLQKAVCELLNPLYEPLFSKNSYGGRPGRSAHQAIATLREAITAHKVSWVFEADLENFFGSLNHGWVERFVSERVGDPRIQSLIRRWLKAGVIEDGQLQPGVEGTAQGGPISVLLSNIYLHYCLDLWIEKVVKPRLSGEMYFVRYLDDFVVLFQRHKDAVRLQRALPKRLGKFGLRLEPNKTRLVSFGRFAAANSVAYGVGLKPETIYFLGFNFYCDTSERGKFKFVIRARTEKTRLRRGMQRIKVKLEKMRHHPLKEQSEYIRQFLLGHYRYYGVSGNTRGLDKMYRYVLRTWRKVLSTRSQRGHVSWEKYVKVLEAYPIPKPKIYMTHRQLHEMANP